MATRSSKPGSALGTSQSKLLLSARQVDVADNGNGNLTFVPTGNAEVVPASCSQPGPHLVFTADELNACRLHCEGLPQVCPIETLVVLFFRSMLLQH